MPASGWTLSPAVTHVFLTHTLEQKSPLFILRCMRSFSDTEHNPFFIILTGFKGMWLFQCDFPIVFVFMLLSGFVSLAFSMTSLWLSVQELLIQIFYWHHSPKKFWKNHPCSLKLFLCTLPVPFAPFPPYYMGTLTAVSASSGNLQCDIRGEMQKEEGRFAIFPTSAASALKWNEATRHHC